MRCDESKPFCRNCLKNGSSCGYTRVEGSTADRPQQFFTAASLVEEVSSNSLLAAYLNKPSPLLVPATVPNWANGSSGSLPLFGSPLPLASSFSSDMMDPFNALPVVMSHNSNMLLDHFNNYRILLQEPVRRPPESQMFAWAVSDAALLHATLVLAAKHWIFLGGSRRLIEYTLYQHKTETIRLVNERLADPVAAVSDGTVGAVGILIFVEYLDGSDEAAAVHLNGLEKMVQMRGDLFSPNMNGLLQRMILLADLLTATANNTKPRFQKIRSPGKDKMVERTPNESMKKSMAQPELVDDSFYKEVGLDSPLVKMFMTLHWLSSMMANNDRDAGVTDNDVLACNITEAEKYIGTMLRGGQYSSYKSLKGVVVGNAFVVLAGYTYLYLHLRRIEISSRLYDWMVSLLSEDLRNVEHEMRVICPPELLFWVLFVGACASVGRLESQWFKKELRVSRVTLGLTSWIDARSILMKFTWVESWNEPMNERLWHELD